MTCPICRKQALSICYRDVEDYECGSGAIVDFYRCAGCRALSRLPISDAERLETIYPSDYTAYSSSGLVSRLKDIQALELFWVLSPKLGNKGAEILELGCGAGHFLKRLRRQGYSNLTAVDWNGKLADIFLDLGIRFQDGDIETVNLGDRRYDCIIMNNVLEHVHDPAGLLTRLKEHLTSNGKIIVRTPNAESVSRAVFGRYWAGLHAPRHTYIFSPQSLRWLVSEAGFLDVRFRPLADPWTWVLSFQNYVLSRRVPRVSSRLVWPAVLFGPLAVFLAFFEGVFRRSSSVIAVLS